jgi:hypothetical protein
LNRTTLCVGCFVALALQAFAQNKTVTVQAKSYIARMVTAKTERDGKPDVETSRALGFEHLVGGRVHAYEVMLAADLKFRENPPDGSVGSQQFRLRSQIQITGRCQGGKLTQWKISAPEMQFGKEGPLDAKGELLSPLKAQPSAAGTGSQAQVTFQYSIKGRPHALTTPAFENVQPRQCYWIWHRVGGTASCSVDQLIVKSEITGSRFPSHRLWQDGKQVTELPQGPFQNLWKCSGTTGLVE